MDKSENTNTVNYKESIEDIYKEIKILKDEIKKLNNFIYEKEEKMKKVIEEKDILINEMNKKINQENEIIQNRSQIKEDNKTEKSQEEIKENDIFKKDIIKKNKIDNYIILTLYIDWENVGKNIKFLNKIKADFNMEKIQIKIGEKKTENKFKNIDKDGNFFCNFSKEGIHKIEIILVHNIKSCKEIFSKCEKIVEIDFFSF
jgi:hypothetical protein